MKVSEAVQHMTKWYLHRIIDSFTRDFPKLDQDQSRDTIVKNVDELTNPERIRRVLSLFLGARLPRTGLAEKAVSQCEARARAVIATRGLKSVLGRTFGRR